MYCILIGGLPAAGKSTLARELSRRLDLPMFSKDDIKELLYDTIGFHSRAEKVALGAGALEAMYYAAGQVMARGGSVILENNFESASLPGLRALLERYNAKPLTLLLTGDPAVLYKRFIERDRSPGRHRGHVVNTQYPEPEGERPPYVPMSFAQYVEGFTRRGMDSFDPGGQRFTVDVTDLDKLDCQALAEKIRGWLAGA